MDAPGYLLPVHDFEAGDGVRSDQEMAQFCIDFSDRIYEVMGIRPAIYTNGNYAANVLGGATSATRAEVVAAYPKLWSARWPNQAEPNSINVQTGEPKDSYTPIYGPWDDYGVTHPWTFWQYASTGRLQSFNNGGSNLDMDVARGGVEFLRDQLVPALWLTDASGSWSTLSNWNSGKTPMAPVTGPGQVSPVGTQTLPTPRLPGAAGSGVTSGQYDTVILDRGAANPTITLSSGTHNIRKLYARENLDITGGSLTINYSPVADSTPISAQFSAGVSLSGAGSLSVHTLQVDSTRTFTLGGGTLAFNRINLMPHSTLPAKMLVNGDVNFNPLANAAAVIANGAGAGGSGKIDLDGAARVFNVGDGSAAADLTISVPVTNGGLTKAGPGMLVLSGANTYSGDTAVLAGALSLANPLLANTADVYLTTGATLDLGFSGIPDSIDSLFIDGVSKEAGEWGAEGSDAEHTSPLITGTGRLNVLTFISPPSPNDFNNDGKVDGLDLAIWNNGFGAEEGATKDMGDGTGDFAVDGADFLALQTELDPGTSSAASSAGVPEPTAGGLAALAAAALLALRARACRPALA